MVYGDDLTKPTIVYDKYSIKQAVEDCKAVLTHLVENTGVTPPVSKS
jgi:hypothetical protein